LPDDRRSDPGRPRGRLLLTPRLDGRDGHSSASRLIADALALQDGPRLRVHTLLEPAGARALGPGATVLASGGNRLRYLAQAARAALGAGAPDHVVCAQLHLLPAAAPFLARGTRVTAVLCGIEAWTRVRWRERAVLRRARLLAISAHTAARFRATNPELAERDVHVCHLGAPAVVDVEEAPADAGEAPFALIVGRMAAVERYKGHDALLDAWPGVAEGAPGARLVVAGEGDDRARLEGKAKGLGLEGAVRFLGEVTPSRLLALYRACAFFVMPSRDEGFGLVFLEAMRAGRACLAARGAAEEIVRHEETGLVVPYGDPAALRAALVRLFREPDTRAGMGRAGEALFRERFTAERFGERFRAALGG
jgi:phosphatidylinositol alpha-1,6-mannosyltransferase